LAHAPSVNKLLSQQKLTIQLISLFVNLRKKICIVQLPLKYTAQLQQVDNTFSQVVTQQLCCASLFVTLLQHHHWLQINWEIRFKLTTLTYNIWILSVFKYLHLYLH